MSNDTFRIREYQVSHKTHYRYSFSASLCHNQLHLRPREAQDQKLLHATVDIGPEPEYRSQGYDSFGNPIEFYSIERTHQEMIVHSKCSVQRHEPVHRWFAGYRFGEFANALREDRTQQGLCSEEFLSPSGYCSIDSEFVEFLKPIWDPNRDTLEMLDLINKHVYSSIQYQPLSTDVTTRSIDTLRSRRGVCQDLANVLISCMRTVGIPARYVSGYLLTVPPPGESKLVGSDASHAWVGIYVPSFGWVDWDPTNNMRVDLDHITLAWGRDYSDVPPIRGVFVGGGDTSLQVGVDVMLAKETVLDRSKTAE
jgi:transglutaminase-like putative cysteine protease